MLDLLIKRDIKNVPCSWVRIGLETVALLREKGVGKGRIKTVVRYP